MLKPRNPANGNQGEFVLLIHGFLSKRLLMKPLARRMRDAGYTTCGWGYPSYLGSLRRHASRLRPELERVCSEYEVVHIVAHSMGTIVLRLALEAGPLPNLGRVVLMAPPIRGTPMARFAGPLFRPFCKGISELSDAPTSLVHQIEPAQELDLGIIAARLDWIVPASRTPLPEQRDHICLLSTHNSMLFLPGGARQVIEYLQNGRFLHANAHSRKP